MSLPGVLAELNEAMIGELDGGFVTCLCVLLAPDGSVTLASAGHPAPFGQSGEVPLESGLPLGIAAGTTYEVVSLRLEPAGYLALVSDGVIEAANAIGELFGFERTRAISGKPANEIAAAAKVWGQNDDITVVTVRRQG